MLSHNVTNNGPITWYSIHINRKIKAKKGHKMYIQIFQIDQSRDYWNVYQKSYSQHIYALGRIRESLYRAVFCGYVFEETLNEVFQRFSKENTSNFYGTKVSVSDIFQIIESKRVPKGFYYCDTYGFQKIAFTESNTLPNNNHIRVILLYPGENGKICDISPSDKALREVIGNDYEVQLPFSENVCILSNRKNQSLPINRIAISEPSRNYLSCSELFTLFRLTEASKEDHLIGYIVFAAQKRFQFATEIERTYAISSHNLAFLPDSNESTILASPATSPERLERIDPYLQHGGNADSNWKIEKCYYIDGLHKAKCILRGPCIICGISGDKYISLTVQQQKLYAEKFLCL